MRRFLLIALFLASCTSTPPPGQPSKPPSVVVQALGIVWSHLRQAVPELLDLLLSPKAAQDSVPLEAGGHP